MAYPRRQRVNRPGEFTIHLGHGKEEGKYFFSSDHQQGWYDGEEEMKAWMQESWVAVSFSLPMSVVGRPGLEDGIVNTIEQYIFVFHRGETEIPNPDPSYIPEWKKG